MVIIGFPGIGKSTLCNHKHQRTVDGKSFIDLESSYFNKTDDWYKNYCELAVDLSNQGHHVFVSSHKEVNTYLDANYPNDIVFIYPSSKLKEFWINKLRKRLESSSKKELKKNERAFIAVSDNFDQYIRELEILSLNSPKIILKNQNYNLFIEIMTFFEKLNF